MSRPKWPAGVERKILEHCESTMREAEQYAMEHSQPCWILAKSQSHGKGRRGREWIMPKGNFAASYVICGDQLSQLGSEAQLALRSFVAALAVYDSLQDVTGRLEDLSLKWPNDVLLQGQKISGILLAKGASHLSIGIGVNLRATPDLQSLENGALPPISLLEATGCEVTSEEFLTLLAPNYAYWEQRLQGEGFELLRDAFLSRAAKRGELITAKFGLQVIEGIFSGIDLDGHLLLSTPQKMHSIAAADVYF